MAIRGWMLIGVALALLAGSWGLGDGARPTKAQEADPAELFQQLVDAGDIDAVMDLFTEDAVFEAIECVGSACVGSEAIRNAQEFYVAEHLNLTIIDSEVSGNTATVTVEIRSDGVQAAGQERILATFTVEVRDGRIAAVRGLPAHFDDPQTVAFFTYLATEGIRFDLGPGRDADQTPGSVFMFPWNGRTQVMVGLEPGPEGVPQPIHIHEGSCDDLGPIRFPLQEVGGGKSINIVDASLDDLRTGDFAINVHQSEEEIGVYVACGDIPAAEAAEAPATGSGGFLGQEGGGLATWWYALVAVGVVLVMIGLAGLRLDRRRS